MGIGLALLAIGVAGGPLEAQSHWGDPGDYVYRVETLQAAPGRLFDLMDLYGDYFDELTRLGEERPMWMRHSQGDQWDLLIVYPIGTMAGYFSERRANARSRLTEREAEMNQITGWREELYARGPDLDAVREAYDEAGLFHVEMFVGLPGKREELLNQRIMENQYYTNIRERGNGIFVRVAGAEFDSFTIGFYDDMKHFADTGDAMTADEDRQAQADAGFTPGEIGLYLRTLLLHHHDSFGVRIPD
jgi:hypothetical protein